MINKPRQNAWLTRTAHQSLAATKRPKRCHLCKKSFPADKYNEHFEACYRFENKRIEETRARTMNRNTQQRTNNQPAAHPQRQDPKRQDARMNPERPQSSNKFRIKNVSNGPSNNSSYFANKSNINKNTRTSNKVEPIKKQVQSRKVEKKQEEKKEITEQERQQSRLEAQRQEMTMFERTIPMQSRQELRPVRRQPIRQSPVQRQTQEPRNQSAVIEPVQHHNRRPVSPISQPSEQQEDTQDNRPSANQRSEVLPMLFVSTVNDPEQQPEANEAEGAYNIQSMIANSNSIIDFIRSNEVMREDETLSIMMAQLQQLNLIAEQISELNSLGRSLSFRIGNAFGIRIHQLQTAIINQIGIALIRGFNGRLGADFNNLVQIQPELRSGFTEEEINIIFEEKFNINEKECSICLQDMKKAQTVLQLQCNHTFHPSCIRQWLISSKKCPMCRTVQKMVPS